MKFSSEYQPKNKNGRKKGVKIGSIRVYNYIAEQLGTAIADTTLINTKQFFDLFLYMLNIERNKLVAIAEDENSPTIANEMARELTTPQRSMAFIERMFDRLLKLEGIDTDPIQVEFMIHPLENKSKNKKTTT